MSTPLLEVARQRASLLIALRGREQCLGGCIERGDRFTITRVDSIRIRKIVDGGVPSIVNVLSLVKGPRLPPVIHLLAKRLLLFERKLVEWNRRTRLEIVLV